MARDLQDARLSAIKLKEAGSSSTDPETPSPTSSAESSPSTARKAAPPPVRARTKSEAVRSPAAAAAAGIAAQLAMSDSMRGRAMTAAGSSPEMERAAKLAKAGLKAQGRNYEGFSLAYMINQEAMTGLKSLKSTGAQLPASGKPKLVKSHIEHPTRLYHIKGKKHVRVRVVPLAASSLNSGDTFVLDHDGTVYVWNGASSSVVVRTCFAFSFSFSFLFFFFFFSFFLFYCCCFFSPCSFFKKKEQRKKKKNQ